MMTSGLSGEEEGACYGCALELKDKEPAAGLTVSNWPYGLCSGTEAANSNRKGSRPQLWLLWGSEIRLLCSVRDGLPKSTLQATFLSLLGIPLLTVGRAALSPLLHGCSLHAGAGLPSSSCFVPLMTQPVGAGSSWGPALQALVLCSTILGRKTTLTSQIWYCCSLVRVGECFFFLGMRKICRNLLFQKPILGQMCSLLIQELVQRNSSL